MKAHRKRVLVPRLPTLVESDYAHRIVSLVRRWQHAARHLVQSLPLVLTGRTDAGDLGLAARLLAKIRGEADLITNDTALTGLARDFGQRVANHHKVDLVRQGRAALGIEVFIKDERLQGALEQFTHESVALIRKLEHATLGRLETLIYRGIGSSMTVADMGDEIAKTFDIGERHARFIARDQVCKIYSDMCELRAAELGVREFDWMTMEDPKVRRLHRAHHGKRFSYNNPPALGLPGRTTDGPGCRCFQRYIWSSIEADVPMQAELTPDALEQAQRIGLGLRVPAEPTVVAFTKTPRLPIEPPQVRR